MGKIGRTCTDKTLPPAEAILCRFSIFYCGCKQPKSVHILKIATKIRISAHSTKRKSGKMAFIDKDICYSGTHCPQPRTIGDLGQRSLHLGRHKAAHPKGCAADFMV